MLVCKVPTAYRDPKPRPLAAWCLKYCSHLADGYYTIALGVKRNPFFESIQQQPRLTHFRRSFCRWRADFPDGAQPSRFRLRRLRPKEAWKSSGPSRVRALFEPSNSKNSYSGTEGEAYICRYNSVGPIDKPDTVQWKVFSSIWLKTMQGDVEWCKING